MVASRKINEEPKDQELELAEDGIIKNIEVRKMLCKSALQNATKFSNGKKIAEIDIRLLNLKPVYQRERKRHVMKIAEHWDDTRCGTLVVSYKPKLGLFNVVDGQHRGAAARMRGVEFLVCDVLENLTDSQEAAFFVGQNDDSKNLSPFDTYNANLVVSGDEETPLSRIDKVIRDVCNAYHVEVKPGTAANRLKSVTEARNIVKRGGRESLEWVMEILIRAGWNEYGKGFGSDIMHALSRQYEVTKGNQGVAETLVDFLKDSTPDEVLAIGNNQYPNMPSVTKRATAVLNDVVTGK